ncbi:MAG: aminotransferase class III-fold pyridoxal phosphate-dependent enzyme [Burkholderiales bacterium]
MSKTDSQDLSAGALAVVGMAARFPGAGDVDQFWENLCTGKEGVRFFRPEDLDPSIPAALRSDPAYVPARGVIDECDKFDAAFFGISPLEAQVMDPQQRIMLELAWSALENAGHPPSRFNGLIGAYLGMNWNRYRTHCLATNPDAVTRFGEFNTALANEYDFLATRIAYKLDLKGPAVSVSTACSTSLVAIAQASQALLNFDCDIALAGGVSVTVPVNSGHLYQEGSMLSADGHCRSFDATSSGTTFNDGAGMVVLRRLEDAIADGDRIYAVVRGFAVNNDGADKVSFTAPSVGGQAAVIQSALEYADIDPATVGLIEAHGTATPLGDPIEVAALKRVFSVRAAGMERCALGSVKSSIGHLVHAAGVAGFIKAALSVYHGKIPPTLFFEKPNPRLGLGESPFYVNSALQDWPAANHPRRAGISSFGVGGTNAHVVIEQAPPTVVAQDSGIPRIVCLSAKSAEALDQQTAALQRQLAANPGTLTLDSIAFTLQVGRESMQHRSAWPVRSVSDVAAALLEKRRSVRGKAVSRRLAFMFTGQGSQRAHMGQWLYENNPSFRKYFDDGAAHLLKRNAFDVREMLFSEASGGESAIDQTRNAQPSLFLLEYSLARTLLEMGLAPDVLLGHSVGEFAAAALAGVFSYEDAISIVAKRGELMQSMARGSMLIVHCGEAEASAYLSQEICLAAVNAPELSVLSGPDDAIDRLVAALDAKGAKSKRLRTSHAFHSTMMEPAADAMRSVLAAVKLRPPTIPIVSTVTGRLLSDAEAVSPEYWARQLRETVRFAPALDAVAEMGEFALLEIGPGSTLTTLALQHSRTEKWAAAAALPGSGMQESADLELLAAIAHCWTNGATVDWEKQWKGAKPPRVPLPTYRFARVRYWLDPPQIATIPALAAAPIAQLPVTPVSQILMNMEVTAMNDTNRRAALESRVVTMLEDTSGYELKDAATDANFLELGFNSLLLTQISTAIKSSFGVAVSFRALMEEITTIGELTAHLVKELPAEAAPAVAVIPTIASVTPQALAPAAALSTPPMASFAPMQFAPSDDVRGLIDKQLAIMQMQLQMLGSAPATSAAAAAAPMAPTVAPAAIIVQPEKAVETKPESAEPRKHTPGTRIERNRTATKQLTRAQQAYVDKLMSDYIAGTAASKAFAQRHRKHMADPRTVSGFTPLWKEMVYPIVTNRSKGSKLWDLDGREYIDFTNGFGPIFFGHSPDFISEAVIRQIGEGIETGPQSPLAGEVAELFCELTGNERVAFANTGSEAVLAALRLARTVTGREKVVMFEGGYHGIFDEVVVRPGKNGTGFPGAPGIPKTHTSNMIVLPYGTDESLERIRGMGDDLAAILVETVQSRKPGLQPVEFIKQLRALTEKTGTALIFDEVVTGFRVHPGGMQAMLDIRADMAVYGKVAAGGYPIGLLGGKSRFLDALDGGYWEFGNDSIPEVGVTFFAGTFVRHPLALAATKAVLERMKVEGPSLQLKLAERTADLAREIKTFLKDIDVKIALDEYSSYFYISLPPEDQYGSLLFYLLRLHGIHAWEFRPWFLTTSHSDADLAIFKNAFFKSASEMVQNGLLTGDAVAVERLNKARSGKPPVEGARLGKDKDGMPAWFVPDPNRPGKFLRVAGG